GVEFTGRLKDAYGCNLWLRTAGRVLCRLSSFRAGAVEELFFKASRIPWELWLNPRIPIDLEAGVEYSRISNEGKVAEVIAQSIEKRLGQKAAFHLPQSSEAADHSGAGHKKLIQKILVRLVENHCQISLDTTGPHLHQRGYRLGHSTAPIRETLAAAILLKAGWKSDFPLVDGMCGSGVFAIEAALMSRRIAPGMGRDFLFQQWPSFQEKSWEYLRRKATESSLKKATQPIVGIDISSEAIGLSKQNADNAGTSCDIDWKNRDFFDFIPAKEGLGKGLVVLNPPYGVRLASGGTDLYEKIGAHLRLNFKGWKYAVLAKSRLEAAALGSGRMRHWNIRHGGINITVAIGAILS
ncbi:MAG: THUMP domain-containing class I SAM-dependent RNA methyltransferase, partial [Syntrophobacteraceae bacterium]